MTGAWRKESWVVLVGLAAALVAGLLLGYPGLALFIAAALYLCWHLLNLWRVQRWLRRRNTSEPPASWGLWEDINYQLRRMQKRNHRRKQRLASILNEFQSSTAALPDGTVILDAVGRIMWCNEAAVALLGLRGAQDRGQRVVNLLRHPVFTEYMRAGRYDHAVETPSPVDPDTQLLLNVVPYGNDQRLLIVRDISDLKRLEQMRRDFVANASHELRTPLTVLRGYLETMQAESDEADSELHAWNAPLTDMLQQSTRMEHIINDMLTLARLESDGLSAPTQIVDVAEIVRKAVAQAEALSQGRHTFDLQLPPEPRVRGRADELQSAFSNLVINAVRHTPPGSEIRIVWEARDDGAALAVSDNGPGIPAADIARLTERFYRVDAGRSRASGGTGLGLAIVKHALERHGAELQIHSEVGAGSTFTCVFPARRVVAGAASDHNRL